MTNKQLTDQAAAYKKDANDLFDKAVVALIALAFRYSYLGANFLWDAVPELNDEANRILRDLSDNAAERAKNRAMNLIRDSGWDGGDDAWEVADAHTDEDIVTRFDQQGSFLKELLEIWIALAFVKGMTQSYLKISVLRYIRNPYLSPAWKELPQGLLKWGRGYQKDLIAQITLIGQDAIISTVRYAEWKAEEEGGASYYIRRRGSGFLCPQCDSECGKPIPISVPFWESHPRCMCWPEYHHED